MFLEGTWTKHTGPKLAFALAKKITLLSLFSGRWISRKWARRKNVKREL